MTFLAFTGLVNFICSTALAIAVYRKCPRRDVGIAYGLMNLAIASFSAFYFLWQCATTAERGLFYLRMLTFCAMWINPSLLYFTGVFLGWTAVRRRIVWSAALGTIFFSILNFTSVMYSSVVPRYNLGFWPAAVSGWFIAYLIIWHSELLYSLGDMIYSRHRFESHKKNQINYMIIAFAIGYFGGITNWPMWFGIHIPPYANILVSVYTLIVAYAMVRHHLMDINVVIRKALLYSLVSAALTAIYVGTITLLAQMLGGPRRPAAALSSALAAIFITLLFNPLRIRTQRWIDRHFPRERLDPDLLQEAAGGFAHEMKRPLSKISLPAEMALMDLERVKNGEMMWQDALPIVEQRLRFIMNQSIDAGYMIEAIRELTMTSSAPLVQVDLRRIIESVLETEKDLMYKWSIVAQFNWPDDFPSLSGRTRQLEIVFINLIKNAAEALSDLAPGLPRKMKIEARREGIWANVLIKDSGPGLTLEGKEKLFLPHYTTKGPRGTGMGLYLSRQIVQGHGGTIEVVASHDDGTTFVVSLPCKP